MKQDELATASRSAANVAICRAFLYHPSHHIQEA